MAEQEKKNVNPLFRCKECRTIASLRKIEEEGFCTECGAIEWKLALKIEDAEVKALTAQGYVFEEEFFDDEAV